MKFEVGEIAVLTISSSLPGRPSAGDEVEVTKAGPIPAFVDSPDGRCASEPTDYEVRDAKGRYWHTFERYLRKRRPPHELGSWDRIHEITNWNPTKETVNA